MNTAALTKHGLKIYRLIIIVLLLFSGNYVRAQSGLFFCNKTPSKIDSIVLFRYKDKITLPSIDSGRKMEFHIPFEWSNIHGVVVCDYKVYFNDKFFKGQLLKGTDQPIFIHQHFNPQSHFTIFINNTSRFPIDKITPANCLIDSTYEVSPRMQAIQMNYLQFLKEPTIEIVTNGKRHPITLDKQEILNLSNLSASIWVSDTSVLPAIVPFESMVEFTVVLQPVMFKIDLESATIKSAAFIKSYSLPNSEIKVLIFDFDELRRNPFFIAKVNGKRFKIKLSERDLSEDYYGRKYFWVYPKSVKAQF